MATQKKEKPIPVNRYVYPKKDFHSASAEAKVFSLNGATRISPAPTNALFLQLTNVHGLRKNVLFKISNYSVEIQDHKGYPPKEEPLWKIWLKVWVKQGYLLISIIASSLYSLACYSQNAVHLNNIGENFMLTRQADSIKEELCADGFVVVKEAFMEMESQYEMPIVVPLNQGTLYQFVFIGDMTSSLYEVRMYDWEERQVVYQKKQWGDVDGNVIRYSYIPQFSEYHMIKPVQVNKTKKQLYGYALLFKKIAPSYKPY